MPLVNAKKMLKDAHKGKYAVGQYNINNLEWTKAVLSAAEETSSPAILGVSEGAAKYMGGFKTVVGMVKGIIESHNIKAPIALHLDHGSSFESCKAAIDAGFTSVMYDGSHDEIAKNVADTKKVVDYAAQNDVSVEAEVGTVGGEEDGVVGGVSYAKFEDCEKIVATNIDFLAASLGSVHGHYDGEPKLGFKEMEEISSKLDIPLVLHGGSGIPTDMIKKAISLGQSKINVNTELQEKFTEATAKYFADKKHTIGKGFDPRKVLADGTTAIKEGVISKMKEFGSFGKAN